MIKMQHLMCVAVLFASTATPTRAFYTECAAREDFTPANRPNGHADPRTPSLEKGTKAAFRDSFGDWWFVTYTAFETQYYGWVPRHVLARCRKMDGTP